MANYKIIAFDEKIAAITIETPGFPSFMLPLPIDPEGNVISGKILDDYIVQHLPTVPDEVIQRQSLLTSGLKNASDIHALVQPNVVVPPSPENAGPIFIPFHEDGFLQIDINTAIAQYPSMDINSVNQIINTVYKNLTIKPYIRKSDAAIIGIEVDRTSGYDNKSGLAGLVSIRNCTNDCIALGLPMLARINPEPGTMDKDKFSDYLKSISKYNKIIVGSSANFVYQDWNVDFAKAQKRCIIDTQRDTKINAGIKWNNYDFDTDLTSRNNLLHVITTINSGIQLPDGFVWRTSDNQNIPMSTVDLIALNSAIAEQVNTCYQESWTRKANLDALPATTTFAEIDAI
jgi:hypothetical protein